MAHKSVKLLTRDTPLADKVAAVQTHLEHVHFAGRDIPVCMPHDGGLLEEPRPLVDQDFEGQSWRRSRANEPGEPHADQTAPEVAYCVRLFSSETPAFLTAYWLGETVGFWKP